MPHAEVDIEAPTRLPFPPISRSHILHCSIHHWYGLYASLTPKTRLISLSPAFMEYLRADGIVLPPEQYISPWSTNQQREDQDEEDEDEEEDADPSAAWPEVHASIKTTIRELGRRVYPKLNWSAPKDATWIAATNSMECNTANDVYLLLKSSDFVTHDLEQAFAGCDDTQPEQPELEIPYTLALRKAVPAMINSMEFRCFVRRRRLIGVCQRDLNHYDFMESLLPILQDLIYDFYEEKLKNTFPDDSFVFDVYIPKPVHGARVWLIDINAWAQHTDPLLFSWLELLTMPDLPEEEPVAGLGEGFVRLSLKNGEVEVLDANSRTNGEADSEAEAVLVDDEDVEELPWLPQIRLVRRDDPEAYSFNSPLYSAHKLPKDVVDAGMTGEGGIRDFLNRWDRRQANPEYESEDEDS